MKMQSFITRGPKNKYCLYVVLTPNKIRPINIFQETKYTLNNENNENTVILENCREKNQIRTNYDDEIHVTKFDCVLKREMSSAMRGGGNVLHSTIE
jgi:hypothetical protein